MSPSKVNYVDYDFDYEVLTKSQEYETNCAAITLLNQGNCSITLNNNAVIAIGGGLSISLDGGLGIPRLRRKLSIIFNDDNTTTPRVRAVAITRTLILSICQE